MTDADRDSDDAETTRDADRNSDDAETTRDADAYVGAYDKLVRDDVPAVVRDDGNEPVTRTVDGTEYRRYLARKLREEADEVVDALETRGAGASDGTGSDRDDLLDELADVHAVLAALVDESTYSMRAVRERAREKADERGGFDDGVVLERIESGERGTRRRSE